MHVNLQAPAWATAIASDLTDMDRAAEPLEPGAELDYELPDDVYFQYAWVDDSGKLRPDPDCPERTTSVWYGEVSEIFGPSYRPDPLAADTANGAGQGGGATERLKIEPAAGTAADAPAWRVTVVSPPGDHDELPLVIAQDGVAFLRIGRPHLIAAELTSRGEARPARFAFIEPHNRNREYGLLEPDSASYQRFLAEKLEPELVQRFPTSAERIYLGASLGAAASARAALKAVEDDPTRAPDTTVLAFSGAFLGAPGDSDYYASRRSWLRERLEDRLVATPARWHLEVGNLEWLLDVNREVAKALRVLPDVEISLNERSAGHNWTNWRNGLASALKFALAPETG